MMFPLVTGGGTVQHSGKGKVSAILKQFIKKPKTIGAFCASTPHLAETITSGIGLEKVDSVVELGPGTGAFTQAIIGKISSDATFFAVELDNRMHDEFVKKFPEVTVYKRCASELTDILKKENLESVDLIISGLPWAIFPGRTQEVILDSIHKSLKPNGTFTTFAYLMGMMLPSARRFKSRLKNIFSNVEKTPVVWKNLPPSFVYRCRK